MGPLAACPSPRLTTLAGLTPLLQGTSLLPEAHTLTLQTGGRQGRFETLDAECFVHCM